MTDRSSDIQLIGAGLPRTGTLTQKLAMEMLGLGPCYHWVDVIADLSRVAQWDRALDGDGQWDEIFDGFRSTVDWPGGHFWRELIDVYPDAKVLLSVREPEAWERSFRETIWTMCHGRDLISLLASARAHVDPQWRDYLAFVDRMFWTGPAAFAPRHERPDDLIEAMTRHNEEVRRVVPDDRLLVWDVKEGWEPLCAFLGVDVPDEPLPHLNDRETFHQRVIGGAIAKLHEWQQERDRQASGSEPLAVSRQ